MKLEYSLTPYTKINSKWIEHIIVGPDITKLWGENIGRTFFDMNWSKIFFIIFKWKIIALQYCVSFYHTRVWISHTQTYIPFLLNLPPTPHLIPPQVVTEHRLELPVLHGSFPLAIFHMVMYIFHCYSLNSSHPLPPLCLQDFYVCVFTPGL